MGERQSWMNRLLVAVEVALYVAFLADCLVLLAGEGSAPSYLPTGGLSLIVILLTISLVHWLRNG